MMLLNWLGGKIRGYDDAHADLHWFLGWNRDTLKRLFRALMRLLKGSQYRVFASLN